MVKRRTVLLGGAATAGTLVIGWGVMPPRQRLHTADPLPVGQGQAALNGWLQVGADNTVTVMMAKSEMGQGAHTGLAAVLADELDADWAQVRLAMAPIDDIFNNLSTVVDGLPFHPDNDGSIKAVAGWLTAKTMREVGVMMTGGSSSIKDLWLPMREAGAHARALLIRAAAAQWNVQASECTAKAGVVQHSAGQRASFGELAALAAQQKLSGKVALKEPAQFTLIGKPLPRIEAPSKTNGTAVFGIDSNPPGLLHASVVMCPTRGGTVLRFDAAAAQKLPGVKKVLAVDAYHGGTGAVAVIADTPWHAKKAAASITVEWNHGPAAALSSDTVLASLTQALDETKGFGYHSTGDVETALQGATTTVSADYRAPYLAHATLEPINCTAQLRADGTATVWVSTQVPGLARMAAAKALGIADEKVDLQQLLLGGGFGRRLEVDYVAQAAAIAKAAEGAPVQTLWSREQDLQHDFYRPACVSRFKAGLNASGQLVAWHNLSAGQAIVPQVLSRTFGLPGAGPDKTTSEGAFDQPYEWPHARIAHEAVNLPLPVGFWRSVGHSHQAFFKECFVDEVAHAAKQDPVKFRAALLQNHPRHLQVLLKAADLAGWGDPLPAGPKGEQRARGVALHQSFGSVVAQVAEVSVGADKTIRVHRVVCVIDCGAAINPNLIAQQMESAVVFGLTAALYGEVTLKDGQVQQSNFHDHPLLRMADCPRVETHIIASAEPPEGVGEPGVPPIAPAVANALFALTGQRLRALPLKLA